MDLGCVSLPQAINIVLDPICVFSSLGISWLQPAELHRMHRF